jgi:hypothetical protein
MLHSLMSVAGTKQESVQTGCSDDLCLEKDSKDHGNISINFPGSWSDVSTGALFEMEIERALPKGEPRLAEYARKNIADQSGEGNCQLSSNMELESGNVQSNHELDDDYGYCGHASNSGQTANAADIDEPELEAFRYFTQRRTSTRSIPIPNRKSHMIYRRQPTV